MHEKTQPRLPTPRPQGPSVLRPCAMCGLLLPRRRTRMAARHNGRVDLVEVGRVLLFRADHKYTAMHAFAYGAAGGPLHEYLIDESLVALEQVLDPARFVRASRSALVNVSYVTGFTPLGDGRSVLHFRGTDALEVIASRRHAGRFRQL